MDRMKRMEKVPSCCKNVAKIVSCYIDFDVIILLHILPTSCIFYPTYLMCSYVTM